MAKKKYVSSRFVEKSRRAAIYSILTLVSFIWLIPFVYLIFQSFIKVPTATQFIPAANNWTLSNYGHLFGSDYPNFFAWWFNTFLIAFVTAAVQTILVLMTAYSLSRLKFAGRQALMKLILILGMFPGFLGMLIIYYMLSAIGLNTSIFSLIIVYTASSAMSYYIAKGFFDTISKSLDEAVFIDGGSKNTVFWRVILPLSKPIIIYTILVSFTGPWGDFMFGNYLVIAGGIGNSGYTVAVGLQILAHDGSNPWAYGVFCAGAVMVSIPITALFFWLQRYYVEGIAGGAVKG